MTVESVMVMTDNRDETLMKLCGRRHTRLTELQNVNVSRNVFFIVRGNVNFFFIDHFLYR